MAGGHMSLVDAIDAVDQAIMQGYSPQMNAVLVLRDYARDALRDNEPACDETVPDGAP